MTTTNNMTPNPIAAAKQAAREKYASRILIRRVNMGLTQEQLAAEIGFHANTVRNVERTGRASPQVGKEIQRVFKIKPLPRKGDWR